jgi:LysM repeat protein
VFLISAADDGSRVIYFVAQNARHAILDSDLQLEQQINALWPLRVVSREEALAYPEGAPVGGARTGLLQAPMPLVVVAESEPDVVELVAIEPMPPVAEPVAEPLLALSGPQPAVAEELAPLGPTVYVLKRGDNLTSISRDHGTTVAAILEANGLTNANRIYAGQTLVIPGTAQPALVAEVPVLQEPTPAPVLASEPIVGTQATIYVLKPGDILTFISRDHGTTVAAILEANGLTNANRIYAGQSLVIPGSAEPALLAEAPESEPVEPASVPDAEPAVAIAPDDQSTEATTYTVKRGDSAIGIARKLGVDVDAMLAANGISDRNRIYQDQILTIPG